MEQNKNTKDTHEENDSIELTESELAELEELEELEELGFLNELEELAPLEEDLDLIGTEEVFSESIEENEDSLYNEEDVDSEEDEIDLTDETVGTGFDKENMHSSFEYQSTLQIRYEMIEIEDIIIPEKKKNSRANTIIGLDSSVKEFGVLTPIHVLKLEDDDSYLLIQGLRRLRACAKAGQLKIMAVILDFGDVEEGKRLANVLDELINRSQHYSNREIWSNFETLEVVNGLSIGMLEFLLQLKAGDAMKLKDVMQSDYHDIVSEFIEGKLTIETAYKKLNTERGKEDRLLIENETTVDNGEAKVESDEEENKELSDDEVDELLDINANSEEMSLDELDRRHEDGVERQEVGDRRPLDPALRQAVLVRDGGTCQCCGKGGKEWLHVMDIHHIIQVSQGGTDTEKNLVTVCINCHQSIHVYAWGKLTVNVKELDEAQQGVFKSIFKFGNIIRDADKRRKGRGVNTSSDKETNVRKMPGVVQSANIKAMNNDKKHADIE